MAMSADRMMSEIAAIWARLKAGRCDDAIYMCEVLTTPTQRERAEAELKKDEAEYEGDE